MNTVHRYFSKEDKYAASEQKHKLYTNPNKGIYRHYLDIDEIIKIAKKKCRRYSPRYGFLSKIRNLSRRVKRTV
ncbi:MAG: hypothetical protein ACLVHQ_06305 [Oscillospiraceae bacterium]